MATGLIEKEEKSTVSLLIRNLVFHLNYEHPHYMWLVISPTRHCMKNCVIYTYS